MPIYRCALTLFATLFLLGLLVPAAYGQRPLEIPRVQPPINLPHSPGLTPQSPTEGQFPPSSVAQIKRKNPENALYYSIVHTMVPAGFGGMLLVAGGPAAPVGALGIAYGILAGPSAGNFYAENVGMGLFGIGLRLLGIVLIAQGTEFGHKSDSFHSDKPGLAQGGFVIYMGSTLWNIITAAGSARTYNARHSIGYKLSPVVDPESRTMGLELSLSFAGRRDPEEIETFEKSVR